MVKVDKIRHYCTQWVQCNYSILDCAVLIITTWSAPSARPRPVPIHSIVVLSQEIGPGA